MKSNEIWIKDRVMNVQQIFIKTKIILIELNKLIITMLKLFKGKRIKTSLQKLYYLLLKSHIFSFLNSPFVF